MTHEQLRLFLHAHKFEALQCVKNAMEGRDPHYHVVPLKPGESQSTMIKDDELMSRQIEIVAECVNKKWRVTVVEPESMRRIEKWYQTLRN